MTKQPPPARSGVAGLLLLFGATAFLIGIGFDLGAGARSGFWIGAQPGAAAVAGAGAALMAVIVGHAARLLTRRKRDGRDGDAGPHA